MITKWTLTKGSQYPKTICKLRPLFEQLHTRFNTYFMKNSIAFRASIVWNLLTPDLAKTSNVKNYTRMASKSDKLNNLDFQAESPQTMPHNYDNDFLYY